MIKTIRGLLGRRSPAAAPKKPTIGPTLATQKADGAYRAVSLVSAGKRCAAAKASGGKRFLIRDAPRLPLIDCTIAAECACKFRKDSDRRDGGDRRLLGVSETARWFAGPEARKIGARRSKQP